MDQQSILVLTQSYVLLASIGTFHRPRWPTKYERPDPLCWFSGSPQQACIDIKLIHQPNHTLNFCPVQSIESQKAHQQDHNPALKKYFINLQFLIFSPHNHHIPSHYHSWQTSSREQCPARVGFGRSRSENWRGKKFHLFLALESEI